MRSDPLLYAVWVYIYYMYIYVYMTAVINCPIDKDIRARGVYEVRIAPFE